MNTAHLHLILNHMPVLGNIFGLGLLAFAVARRDPPLQRLVCGVFILTALLAVPAYLTGEPAEEAVKNLPGVAESLIERHENAAGVALGGVIALGVTALAGVLWFRGARLPARSYLVTLLLGALIVSGLMAWAANLGGQVRHTEIRAATSGPRLSHPDHD